MKCPKCNAPNDPEHLFCVNCGAHLAPPTEELKAELPPTQIYQTDLTSDPEDSPVSIPTAIRNNAPFVPSTQNFTPSVSSPIAYPAESGKNKFVLIGAIAVFLLLIGGGIFGAFLVFNKQPENTEMLPDHLGMFVQNKDKNDISEILKQDFTDTFRAKEEFLKNDSLLSVEDKPNVILYSDSKELPINDLKLVQLDTIKEDGTLLHINYQVVPIEGKAEMKRLRIPEGLANGKYAFALFDGFLDEGKHKFWAFQVKNTQKNDNGNLAKEMNLSLKPTPSPSPKTVAKSQEEKIPVSKPNLLPPSDEIAYCRTNNVVLRSSPSLNAAKVAGLYSGQKVYILNYSDNYDTWRGSTANWAYVATENGKRGWVFTPLIRY